MVKDEENFIAKTLQPFLDAGIHDYLILDTGSKDNTITVTQELFDRYKVQRGYIVEQPFVDFATSRNYALECAEKYFPTATFLCMIDAEWYVHNVGGLVQFCKEHTHDPVDSFSIRVCHQNNEYYVRRIFKKNKRIRFVEPVHEYALVQSYGQLPPDIYILFDFTEEGVEKSRTRWYRDIEVLLKEHEKNPDNLRTLFYLGQTYSDLHDYEKAIYWYNKRFLAGGWLEEQLLAGYRIAQIYDIQNNWPMACHYYIQTYNLNPTRAESLTALARHYFAAHNFHASLLFAKQACSLQIPIDAAVIHRGVYLYERFMILLCSAWQLEQYEIGLEAIKKALLLHPTNPYFLESLQLFEEKLQNNRDI